MDEALECVDRALVEHERLDWRLERARTLLVRGSILRRLGRRRDAATALAEARSAFAELRNPLWQAKAEAEGQRLGGRRGAGDDLTPAEKRVAELAGQGLRNAEIAARLFVTPKTVEGTLSRVYRKLGVRSRTELARSLAERSRGRRVWQGAGYATWRDGSEGRASDMVRKPCSAGSFIPEPSRRPTKSPSSAGA